MRTVEAKKMILVVLTVTVVLTLVATSYIESASAIPYHVRGCEKNMACGQDPDPGEPDQDPGEPDQDPGEPDPGDLID